MMTEKKEPSPEKPRLSVVLPLYRNEAAAGELIRRIAQAVSNERVELVAVDDASPDQTAEAIQSAARAEHLDCRIVTHIDNRGQHASLIHGLQEARGETIVFMDADLQDPPELIMPLVRKLRSENLDLVLASRREQEVSWSNRMSSRLFKTFFIRAMGQTLPITIGLFGALSAHGREELLKCVYPEPFFLGMLLALSGPKAALEYDRDDAATSGYTFSSRCALGWKGVKFLVRHRALTRSNAA